VVEAAEFTRRGRNPDNAAVALFSHRDYDPLLLGSPLRRRGPCLAIGAALLVLLGFAALVQLGLITGMRADIERVFLAALALSSCLALVPLSILWYLDRRERETPWLFAAAFFWGGLIATGLALPFNTAFAQAVDAWVAQNPVIGEALGPDAARMLSAPISAPLIEESSKALGLLVLFWLLRAEFDNMRDGIVYGALVGLGFTWFEAPVYVAQGYAETGVAPWGMQLGWRYALFGFGGHALFTALFGASLGLALQTRRRWLRWLAPIGGLAASILAHALNNALPLFFALAAAAAGEPPPQEDPSAPGLGFLRAFLLGSAVELTVFLPFVVILAFALWRSGVWERRVIREELAAEVGRTVSAREYAEIAGDRMFRTRRIDRARPRESAALVNAQHELAFRKRRVRDAGRDPESDRLVARWREEIRRLAGAGAG
jgi:RsiW-degrading membrane proteinase PrsW (M82 family)